MPRQNTFDGKFNNGLSSVGENEDVPVPEPPPRPAAGNFVQIKPPPLPPKKLATDAGYKPPPRPPYADEPNYDYIGSYESSYKMSCDESPPLPGKLLRGIFVENGKEKAKLWAWLSQKKLTILKDGGGLEALNKVTPACVTNN